jgi:hypothetical protein
MIQKLKNSISTNHMKFIASIFFILVSVQLIAQTEKKLDDLTKSIDSLKVKLDKLSSKSVRFGLSIGYRQVRSKFLDNGDYQTASISPMDTTLRLENLDGGALVISTSVIITPFINAKWVDNGIKILEDTKINNKKIDKTSDKYVKGIWLKKGFYQFINNIGVQANINLIDFTKAQEQFTFNNSVEGGLGLAYRLSDKVYFSAHYELFFSRQLRSSLKSYSGSKIFDQSGNLVTSIEQLEAKNENYYITKSIQGFVYRIIIAF